MRHYVPQKNNPDWMPHNVYMQILYLIRDYGEGIPSDCILGRKTQKQAVDKVIALLQEEYKKRPTVYEAFNPLRAFLDFPYFSVMFIQNRRGMGAGKRAWNLYRSHFARLVARELKLY